MALMNTKTINPDREKIVRGLLESFPTGVIRRCEMRKVMKERFGLKWNPGWITANRACKTAKRGMYNINVFGVSSPAKRAVAHQSQTTSTRPLSMTPDAIRKRKMRLLARQAALHKVR